MLEAKHSVSAHINPSYQALLAFKPRQVVLAEQFKRPKTMKHFGSKTQTLNPDQKPLLIHSVLRYLECNGFSRALKRLLSEAQIESDSWKSCSVNLEDVYGKYLETSTCAEQNMSTFKEQDGDKHRPTIEQKLGKKRRGHESESHAGANQSGTADTVGDSAKNSREILTTDLLADLKVELKAKKESKEVSASLIQISDTIYDMQIDESAEQQKDRKKKKSKSVSESVDGDVGKVKLGSLPSVNEEKYNNLKPSLGDTKVESEVDVQSKDKKKKNKPSSNTDELGGNVEKQSLLSLTVTEDKSKDFISSIGDSNIENEAEGKSKDKKRKKKKKSTDSVVENVQHCGPPLENIHAVPVDEKLVESKDKKKKKKVSVSEPFSGVAAEVPNKEDPTKSELKKEPLKISEDTIDEEKKSSKKRKILASDENDGQSVEKLPTQQSKRRKTERLEDTKGSEQLTGDNEDGGKESKGEHGPVGETEFQNTSIKQLKVHANGNVGKHIEKSAVQKTRREKCNGSAEPKAVNAFQRVKIDEVKFADERLQDNSYWAKSGADSGYGAKAQEILGQVRGRDFRHEKTKKKRGSYRGGQIDQETHSIKFHYSDDE